MIFNKTRKYFQEKVRIDKRANKSTAYKVQVYNNAKIDELVKSMNNGETGAKPSSAMVSAELSILNKPDIYKNYNKIINSKYTSNDAMDKMLVKNKANKDLERVVKNETERIIKNLNYVEKVMQKYNIPQQYYDDFRKNQYKNSVANRQQLLKDVAVKAGEINASEGFNISTSYNYRNLEASAENMLRQSQMQSKHEEINAINENYLSEGKDEIYTGKEWIWTGAGATTRHASNDHQKREVNEPFIIVNDETLEIDELMYPSDPAGSYGNTFICYCEIEYLTDYGEATPIDLSDFEPVDNPILSGDADVNSLSLNPLMFMEKPKGEFIDTELIKNNLLEEEGTNGQYWMNERHGAYKNNKGIWEYKGLEADGITEFGDFGKWNVESIARHNYEVKSTEPNIESNIKTQLKLEKQNLSFEEIKTPTEVANYFEYEYKGVLKEIPKESAYYESSRSEDVVEGKVHYFTDPKNDNCKIYIFDEMIDAEKGIIKGSWYNEEFLKYPEEYKDLSKEELEDLINTTTYPINQLFADYEDIPLPIRSSIGELVINPTSNSIAGGSKPIANGKCIVRLDSNAFETTGYGGNIKENARSTLFHEVSHSFSHKLGYNDKVFRDKEWDNEFSSSYLAQSKEYKRGRREDKKLNGDKYATNYARESKSFDEEQADVGSAMLLKALGKNDPNSNNHVFYLESARGGVVEAKDIVTLDEFLARYPNRVKALNQYMRLDLNG